MRNHHALLLEATASIADPAEFLRTDSEVRRYTVERFGIEDSRQLIEEAHRLPAPPAAERVLIVETTELTVEAQHALLKLLEEPPLTTRFIFAVATSRSFLPTLRSRFAVVERHVAKTVEKAEQPFAQYTLKEALVEVERRTKNKDTAWVQTIKDQLTTWLSSAEFRAQPVRRKRSIHQAVLRLQTRGAMNKWLLEHLALLLCSR